MFNHHNTNFTCIQEELRNNYLIETLGFKSSQLLKEERDGKYINTNI